MSRERLENLYLQTQVEDFRKAIVTSPSLVYLVTLDEKLVWKRKCVKAVLTQVGPIRYHNAVGL